MRCHRCLWAERQAVSRTPQPGKVRAVIFTSITQHATEANYTQIIICNWQIGLFFHSWQLKQQHIQTTQEQNISFFNLPANWAAVCAVARSAAAVPPSPLLSCVGQSSRLFSSFAAQIFCFTFSSVQARGQTAPTGTGVGADLVFSYFSAVACVCVCGGGVCSSNITHFKAVCCAVWRGLWLYQAYLLFHVALDDTLCSGLLSLLLSQWITNELSNKKASKHGLKRHWCQCFVRTYEEGNQPLNSSNRKCWRSVHVSEPVMASLSRLLSRRHTWRLAYSSKQGAKLL